MSKGSPLIISHLSHVYDHHQVLNNVNISLLEGEFLSILGTSGSGKSTLLRVIAGLTIPTEGQVTIAGKLVFADGKELVPAERRQVGLVFQDYALFPYLTVWENIAFGLSRSVIGRYKEGNNKRVAELLELIGMQQFAKHKPSELSGGQQQRVALARALAAYPKLLLLDEPFSNVDATLRQALGDELQMLVRSQGVTVILVTHDRIEAFALADRVAILQDLNAQGSHIVQCGAPEQVYYCPFSQSVAKLTGPASFVPAQAQGDSAKTAFGNVALRNRSYGQGILVFRPEMVSFELASNGEAEVVARLFQGHSYRLLCRTPHGDCLASSVQAVELGTRGKVTINQMGWMLFDKTMSRSYVNG